MIYNQLRNKISILFFISFFVIKAQNSSEDWAIYSQKYPNYHEVVLLMTTKYKISNTKKGVEVISNSQKETLILKDLALKWNIENVNYDSFNEIKNLEAYTLTPKGEKYQKNKVVDFKTKEYISKSNFHDGGKEIEFKYPLLAIGAKKIYSYETIYNNITMIQGEYFYDRSPIHKGIFEIEVDKSIEIGYKIMNNSNDKIKLEIKDLGNKNLYTFTANEIISTLSEDDSPSELYFMPHIILYIKNYTQNNQKVNVLNSLDDLYELYKKYTSQLNITEDSDLKETTLKVVENCKSEEEKVKAIYYWVKSQIKYIAFEEGYDGFVPRQAKDVFKKKYGDCKDMSSILVEMMKYAGVKNSYLGWIGSREKPYSYSDFPTQSIDNHMIAVYKNPENKYIFLDATSQYTPYGYPTSFIQGKECLIGKGEKYEIYKVPVVDPNQNIKTEVISISLNNNIITGESKSNYIGYRRETITPNLLNNNEKNTFEFIRSLTEKGNNKFILKDFKVNNLENLDKPLEINYNFEIGNYSTTLDNEIYINLFLDKVFETSTISKNRILPIEKEFLINNSIHVTFNLPEGFKSSYIPKNDSFTNKFGSYKIEYIKNEKQIILKFSISTHSLYIYPNEFEEYNQFIVKLKENYSESISIIK